MSDALRVRLEGRLEVLERATALLVALDARLRNGAWTAALAETRAELAEWNGAVQPALDEALEAARRADATQVLAQLADAQERLAGSLADALANTEVSRQRQLGAQLAAWQRLAAQTGLPARPGLALAEASFTDRSWGWQAILTVAGALWLLGRPIEASVLVGCAGAAWGWVTRTTRYRLFPDALVVEREGELPVEVPLDSLQDTSPSPGTTLRGLIDLELPLGQPFDQLCEQLGTLFSEREQLAKEQRVLGAFTEGPGLWLEARLQPAGSAPSATVEILRFEKAAGAAPRPPVSSSAPGPVSGAMLVTARGALFVGETAEPRLRRLLFDTEPVELLRREQRPVTAFPEKLLLDHFDPVCRLSDVHWLSATEPLEWATTVGREAVTIAAGRLSVAVNDDTRARLRGLWAGR